MKSGRSIQDVSREILRQQEAKADYLVATDRLHMDTWGDSPVIRVLDREGIDQIEPLEIQQTAHQQIGTYLDIPSKYYDRMLQRDPALLSYNVNRWFQKEPEQKLLRTMDGKARAFLSNRYRRIDNLDIARVVLPIIGEMEGARFESCEITDDRMYLKVVNPRLQAEVVPGDIVQAVRHMRKMNSAIAQIKGMREDELFEIAKQLQVPFDLVAYVHENGKLPVVNFAAGGVATPADAALMMQLGAEGVFVGSGIFKSGNPEKRANAIVKAVTNYTDAKMIARLSEDLGEAMVGINESEIQLLMAERGK